MNVFIFIATWNRIYTGRLAQRYTKIQNMIMLRKLLTLTVLFLLASCASNTGVIQVGEGKLFIAKQAATGFPGTGGIKNDALQEASEYCTSKNKSLNVIELEENEGPYLFGKYPRVELTFTCE